MLTRSFSTGRCIGSVAWCNIPFISILLLPLSYPSLHNLFLLLPFYLSPTTFNSSPPSLYPSFPQPSIILLLLPSTPPPHRLKDYTLTEPDPLIDGIPKRENPFIKKSTCTILWAPFFSNEQHHTYWVTILFLLFVTVYVVHCCTLPSGISCRKWNPFFILYYSTV